MSTNDTFYDASVPTNADADRAEPEFEPLKTEPQPNRATRRRQEYFNRTGRTKPVQVDEAAEPGPRRPRYIDKEELYSRIPVSSDSARQRWEEHRDPRLRLPRGIKFTPGGRLFWEEEVIDAWETRVREHARAAQFDPDEIPVEYLPTAREILEAEIAKLRDDNAAQRAIIDAQDAEIEALRDALEAAHASSADTFAELRLAREGEARYPRVR